MNPHPRPDPDPHRLAEPLQRKHERPSPPHHRICLLFDLDCFYAQCERVRLGLPEDVCLALLQWNSVLAVTYPAREFGIRRGDSWEDVAEKSNNQCWAIHLQVLEKDGKSSKSGSSLATATTTTTPTTTKAPMAVVSPLKVKNPYLKPKTSAFQETKQQEEEEQNIADKVIEDTEEATNNLDVVANVEEAFDRIYKLSPEEQFRCQQQERGVRRFHSEGKACLERYRLASMRIFSVVMESLKRHLGKNQFILERASIDEFYLDITDYCYEQSNCVEAMAERDHNTVVVGKEDNSSHSVLQRESLLHAQTLALNKACQVSYLIRQDVRSTLGFTMSAGISTNKTMAKLSASYGKPNGQAVLHVSNFTYVLGSTKIRKVRHFGGKLGKAVLKVLKEHSSDPTSFDGDLATMQDLQHIPLPILQEHFSEETANFVFGACRGVDNELVRETTGALVKSITAFKSFPATSHIEAIQNWLSLMANEVVTRVAKDSVRNRRYPKTCTLNYTYYTTATGSRPKGVASTRSCRVSKSIRLQFPREKAPQKAIILCSQSIEKLYPILKQHALRGVGLSVSNFDSRGCPPDGVQGISSYFNKQDESASFQEGQSIIRKTNSLTKMNKNVDKVKCGDHPTAAKNDKTFLHENNDTSHQQFDEDQQLAKKLQASFDRENFVFSTVDRRRQRKSNAKNGQSARKNRKIDSFFGKK